MNSKTNDCSVCSVMNALLTLGITVDRAEVEKATEYDGKYGGFGDHGLKNIGARLGLQGEYYPKYNDIVWVDDPIRERVRIASVELNQPKFFEEYKKRLKDGWVAVTCHRWENTENFHGVALIGIEDEKIKVCCSLKGVYLADKDIIFIDSRGRLNGLMTTYWVRK